MLGAPTRIASSRDVRQLRKPGATASSAARRDRAIRSQSSTLSVLTKPPSRAPSLRMSRVTRAHLQQLRTCCGREHVTRASPPIAKTLTSTCLSTAPWALRPIHRARPAWVQPAPHGVRWVPSAVANSIRTLTARCRRSYVRLTACCGRLRRLYQIQARRRPPEGIQLRCARHHRLC